MDKTMKYNFIEAKITTWMGSEQVHEGEEGTNGVNLVMSTYNTIFEKG